MIDNSKFIIPNAYTDEKYNIRVVADVTSTPCILKIEQDNIGLVYFGKYDPCNFFTTATSLIIIGPQIYVELSEDNCNDFQSPILKLNELLDRITNG
jgi:hypothetical protein